MAERENPPEPITKDSAPDKSRTEPSPIACTDTQIPAAAVAAHASTQQKSYRLEKWRFVVEILTLLAVVGYGIVAFLQWEQMRRSTDQAKLAAEAALSAAHTAEETLKTSRLSFQIEQRPYVIADIPQFIQPLAAQTTVGANVTLKNIGRTPAMKERTFIALLRYQASSNRDKYFAFIEGAFESLRKEDTGGGKYGPLARKDVAPGATFFSTAKNPIPLSDREIPDMEIGALNFFYIGIVKYTDAFDAYYETEFCYFYFGREPKTWHICDSHNIIR